MDKNLFSENDKKMITPDGNIYRYIGSDKIDSFEVGDCADISFPNGYNKGCRVYKSISPSVTVTTVDKFIVKLEAKSMSIEKDEIINAMPDGTSRTIKAQYQQTSRANLERVGSYGATGVKRGIRIRKLTPTECYKLMGFTTEDCKKVSEGGISNAQLYKQAGNSIVVNVLEAIFKSLGETYKEFQVCK